MSIKILSSVVMSTAGAGVSNSTFDQNGFETWLPWAAKQFAISPDPKDYYMNTTVILIGDLPNRNGVAFPTSELAKWNRDLGRQAYKGWVGMPLHVEHKSDVDEEAIGVVADVAMTSVAGHNGGRVYKVVGLVAVDTTKNPKITGPIARGERTTWSMGAMVNGYTCSYCGSEEGKCRHYDKEEPVVFFEKNGILVHRNVYGVTPFEFSSVGDPAFGAAIHNHEWNLSYKDRNRNSP